MSTFKCVLYHFVCILVVSCNIVSSDDIPVMLWNIKGNALQIKPVSALGPNDEMFAESLESAHLQESNIIVFAVNKLSLEDFSANDKHSTENSTVSDIESFLDTQPHMYLPSVKDPLTYIHKTSCGVQEIVVADKVDKSIIQAISSAFQRSCVIVLHISDDGIVAKEDKLNSVFLPAFSSSKKNIIGIFTGVKSSWGSPSNERHIFRNLLQAAPSVDDTFVNYTNCIIMFTEKATVKISGEGNNSVALPFPPSLDGSSCSNDSKVLQLTFQTSGALSSVTLKFDFNVTRGSWKTAAVVSMAGEKAYPGEIEMDSNSMLAPIGFSFSCGDLVLKPKNRSYEFSIYMNRFQIQPYQIKDAFSDSFDCVPFFTIPIWMGIFVSLLFIIITNIGIYALFSVHTMDRFDDPKGKTISVATTAD